MLKKIAETLCSNLLWVALPGTEAATPDSELPETWRELANPTRGVKRDPLRSLDTRAKVLDRIAHLSADLDSAVGDRH